MTQCHDESARQVLAGLKDFQRATVEHAFRRLYLDANSTHRFLVADEVGLGKTKIAAGLMAKTIAHLQGKVERVDVIYICSNADIARQNLNSLRIPGIESTEATRITLMPLVLNRLQTGEKANLIALTPGTSFDVGSGAGRSDERALLYFMCQSVWQFDDTFASRNVFRVDAGHDSFQRDVDRVRVIAEQGGIHDKSLRAFQEALPKAGGAGGAAYKARFGRLSDQFGAIREMNRAPDDLRREARLFVGELRSLLVRTCLRMLEPDLIILDEFQRFKHLLGEPATDEIQLAHDLFNYQDETSRARVLLLSATPYKMYTLSGEVTHSGDEHYADFIDTVDFLHKGMPDGAARQIAFTRTLGDIRKGLQQFDLAAIPAYRDMRVELETQLKQVMVRTERLAASADRSGMLVERALPAVDLRLDDVLAFDALQKVRVVADADDALEYWKSAPYVLNFMEKDGYQLKKRVMAVEADAKRKVRAALRDRPELSVPWAAVETYERVDPPNARMRALAQDVIEARGLWKLLWMPPSWPYTQPAGPYAGLDLAATTKRLVFSSWKVVPRAVATLLSYEAERRMTRIHSGDARNTPEARDERRPLLNFVRDQGRPAAMNLMALYYPSSVLALSCDPLAHAGAAVADLLRHFETVIADQIASTGIAAHAAASGKVDEAWYWAAPVLLDLALHGVHTRDWLRQSTLAGDWSGEESDEDALAWHAHVAELCRAQTPEQLGLGVIPDDLVKVLALVALAGPAVCMLRSITRVTGGFGSENMTPVLRTAAGNAGLALRSLFNQAESISLVRGLYTNDSEPYWLRTLRYSADGNLQAMLDEYVHLLRETSHPDAHVATVEIAAHLRSVLTMRTANNRIDRMDPDDIGSPRPKQVAMRLRFAMRYGAEQQDDGQIVRADVVRKAFNSPFHPFVLATTSMGQEGLDFHRYCHAIVHWNLPSNPVDMEQREGRIHRYKGHAVRKNLALRYGEAMSAGNGDPWGDMFAAAIRDRDNTHSDITPFWVYANEGGSRIERYVPALPLSRDVQVYADLRQSLAAYRMVFGQSRQQELLQLLASRVTPERLAEVVDALRVNLEPAPESN